jgi:glycosyltransferase involved in cell wall biosynthesis
MAEMLAKRWQEGQAGRRVYALGPDLGVAFDTDWEAGRADWLLLAPREPGLLERLSVGGHDLVLIDEDKRRLYKYSGPAAWGSPSGPGVWRILCAPRGSLPLVCFFSHSGDRGGAELALLEQVRRVSASGILCHAYVPAAGFLADAMGSLGVAVAVAPVAWWASRPGWTMHQPAAVAQSVATLLPDVGLVNPDLIYTETGVVPVGGIIAKALEKPHLWSIAEFGERDHGLEFRLPEAERYCFIAGHSTRVLFNSRTLRDHAVGLCPGLAELSLVVHYGLPQPAAKVQGAGYFRRPSDLKLLLLGSLQEGKGQEDAVAAAAAARRDGAELELILAGPAADAAYSARLESMIEALGARDWVRRLGPLEDPSPLMAEADCVLMCSRSEAFGRVTAEAMLMGKPVLGLDAGATPELVSHGQTGFLYQAGDLAALAGAILHLAKRRGALAELGAAGKADAQRRFSEAANGAKYLSLIRGLLDPGGGPAFPPLLAEGFAAMRENYEGTLAAIYASRRWRVGSLASRIWRALTLRPKG